MCNQGIYPLECTTVPMRFGDVDFQTDATLGDGEYYGAVELPMTNVALHDSGGRAYVALNRDTRLLRVFFDDIAVNVDSARLSILLDHDRYQEAVPNTIFAPDRAYVISFSEEPGEASTNFGISYPLTDDGETAWIRQLTDLPEEYKAVAICSPQDDNVKRCDVEFQIPLSESDLAPTQASLSTGASLAAPEGPAVQRNPAEQPETPASTTCSFVPQHRTRKLRPRRAT